MNLNTIGNTITGAISSAVSVVSSVIERLIGDVSQSKKLKLLVIELVMAYIIMRIPEFAPYEEQILQLLTGAWIIQATAFTGQDWIVARAQGASKYQPASNG